MQAFSLQGLWPLLTLGHETLLRTYLLDEIISPPPLFMLRQEVQESTKKFRRESARNRRDLAVKHIRFTRSLLDSARIQEKHILDQIALFNAQLASLDPLGKGKGKLSDAQKQKKHLISLWKQAQRRSADVQWIEWYIGYISGMLDARGILPLSESKKHASDVPDDGHGVIPIVNPDITSPETNSPPTPPSSISSVPSSDSSWVKLSGASDDVFSDDFSLIGDEMR